MKFAVLLYILGAYESYRHCPFAGWWSMLFILCWPLVTLVTALGQVFYPDDVDEWEQLK